MTFRDLPQVLSYSLITWANAFAPASAVSCYTVSAGNLRYQISASDGFRSLLMASDGF